MSAGPLAQEQGLLQGTKQISYRSFISSVGCHDDFCD
uniref:Uncharacterized protein n=1 Tax=Triticum urartu TaxID=4572 RepID=A0A8R7PZ24_TRIUA